MLVVKRYLFHYDKRMASAKNSKYIEHDGQECSAYFLRSEEDAEEPTTFDVVHVVFADGFHANVFAYELEAIN